MSVASIIFYTIRTRTLVKLFYFDWSSVISAKPRDVKSFFLIRSAGQPAYLRSILGLRHYTPTRTLRSTNQFLLEVPRFSTEFGKKRLVTWLLQSGMDNLLISDFQPLSTTPWNAVWKLTFSNSSSTSLPCCPPSDCQRLWFSTTTECARVINACIIVIIVNYLCS